MGGGDLLAAVVPVQHAWVVVLGWFGVYLVGRIIGSDSL